LAFLASPHLNAPAGAGETFFFWPQSPSGQVIPTSAKRLHFTPKRF